MKRNDIPERARKHRDTLVAEIAKLAHLHEDEELPEEEEERPWYCKKWCEEYPGGPYRHPEDLWWQWLTEHKQTKGRKVLDIGGGNGILCFSRWNPMEVHVLDVQPPLEQLKHLKQVVTGDCETALDVFGENSFDIVQFTEIIEHLRKVKGRRMLEMLPKLARSAVIVTTPGGFSWQPEYLGNPYNMHISGWTPMDFLEAGYEVWMNGSQIIATMWL